MAPTLVNANRAEIPFANSNRTMGHHTFQRLVYRHPRATVAAMRRMGVKVTMWLGPYSMGTSLRGAGALHLQTL